MDYAETCEEKEKINEDLEKQPKTRLLTAEVSLTDTDAFNDLMGWAQEILTDDRIDDEVREEYLNKLPGEIY